MTDRFEEVTGKLAKIGIQQIPVVGLVVQVAEAFLPPGADQRLKDAVQGELEATVSRLQARVEEMARRLAAQGKQLDELGALRTTQLFRDFIAAAARAGGDHKVEALLNAAAHQFDPAFGDSTLRRYWYDFVAGLSDAQLFFVQLLSEHQHVVLDPSPPPSALGGTESGYPKKLELQSSDIAALWEVAIDGINEQGALFVQKTVARERGGAATQFALSLRGQAVASFIAREHPTHSESESAAPITAAP